MIRSLTRAFGLFAAVAFGSLIGTAGAAVAGEYGETAGKISVAADQCAVYGYGFVESGHGTCTRTHVRIEGARSAATDGYGGGTASSAALRFDSPIPDVGPAVHLRVRNGLDNYGR